MFKAKQNAIDSLIIYVYSLVSTISEDDLGKIVSCMGSFLTEENLIKLSNKDILGLIQISKCYETRMAIRWLSNYHEGPDVLKNALNNRYLLNLSLSNPPILKHNSTKEEGIEWLKDINKNYLIPFLDDIWSSVKDASGLYRKFWGYANYDIETVNRMVAFIKDKTCLEIMCGGAILSTLLRSQGVNVVASIDDGSWKEAPVCSDPKTMKSIKKMDWKDAMLDHKFDCLLVSWIPMSKCDMMLSSMYKYDYLVLLGETEGGCCASDDFFEKLRKEWKIEEYSLNNSWGLHDRLILATRKTVPEWITVKRRR